MEFHPGRIATDEVVYARHGALGRIRLNRPKAINALTHAMVVSMLAQLDDWAGDESVRAVVIDGAGDRGLCAGGDVRQLREAIVHGDGDPERFWDDEYRLNAAIANYPKPYVAIMDGVVMGGGVGVSVYGSLRLVTPRSKVAMPETGIGFFPDVGVLYPLSRAPGELGTHAALTGMPMTGADAVLCGLADAVVEPDTIEPMLAALADGKVEPDTAVADGVPVERGALPGSATTAANVGPGDGFAAPLAADREWIDTCYRGDDAVAILAALRNRPETAARHAAEVLESRSPLSVAVTLAAIRRAAFMSLTEVLDQDRHLGRHFAAEPDFVEGVRAVLVDRDHNPRWRHNGLAEVPAIEVKAMFGDRNQYRQ
ncbi:MAG: 3-hydroxyisobutyryl-CoA hydrolase [Stackebrandtia sp.]